MSTFIASQLGNFLFVLVRISGIVFMMPVWAGRAPFSFKIFFTMWLGVLFSCLLPASTLDIPDLPLVLAGLLREFLVGLVIGFFIRLIYTGILLAGQVISFQMGLAVANVLDPNTSEQHSIITQFLDVIFLLTFLLLDGHLLAIRVLHKSFSLIPPFSSVVNAHVFSVVIREGGTRLFSLAFQIALPVVVMLLLTYLILGLIARVAPQINVFLMGFPLTIMVGLLTLLLGMPIIVSLFQDSIKGLAGQIMGLMHLLGG